MGMTPEQARSWLIEQGEITLDEAAEATTRGQERDARMERLAQRDDWVGEIYRQRRNT